MVLLIKNFVYVPRPGDFLLRRILVHNDHGISDTVAIRSHAGTVVPECYKDDVESQWKSLKFDPRHPKTPEPMATQNWQG